MPHLNMFTDWYLDFLVKQHHYYTFPQSITTECDCRDESNRLSPHKQVKETELEQPGSLSR